jgi:hypothetical protein
MGGELRGVSFFCGANSKEKERFSVLWDVVLKKVHVGVW